MSSRNHGKATKRCNTAAAAAEDAEEEEEIMPNL